MPKMNSVLSVVLLVKEKAPLVSVVVGLKSEVPLLPNSPPVLEDVLPNPEDGTPINAMLIHHIVTVDTE